MSVTGAVRKPRASARFDVRLSDKSKEAITRAAEITGRSATEFVRSAIENEAQRVLESYERTVLTERDRKVFFEALLNPAAPSKALLDAAKQHKELVTSS